MPRYTCDDPEFEGNFIEYSDAWSLREVDTMTIAKLDAMVPLAARKVTALHLDTVSGEPIVDAAELTNEALEEIDLRLYYWLAGTFARIAGDIGELGKTLRRTLFVSSAETTDGAPPPA